MERTKALSPLMKNGDGRSPSRTRTPSFERAHAVESCVVATWLMSKKSEAPFGVAHRDAQEGALVFARHEVPPGIRNGFSRILALEVHAVKGPSLAFPALAFRRRTKLAFEEIKLMKIIDGELDRDCSVDAVNRAPYGFVALAH